MRPVVNNGAMTAKIQNKSVVVSSADDDEERADGMDATSNKVNGEEVDAKHSDHSLSPEQSSHSSSLPTLWTLCLCMLTQTYLLVSIFPYSGFLVVHLVPHVTTPDTAGSYAGLLAAALMLGRACASVAWGRAADTYGRSVTLQLSFALSVSQKWLPPNEKRVG